MDIHTIRKIFQKYLDRLAEVEMVSIEKLEVNNLSIIQIHQHIELYFAEYLCKSKDKINTNTEPVCLLYRQLINLIDGNKNKKTGWW